MKKVLFIYLVLMIFWVRGQSVLYTYQLPPATVLSYQKFIEVNTEVGTIDLGPALATAQRNKNYDYTEILQSLINKYKKVRLPGIKMLINDKGLSIPTGARIYFSNGTVLKMKPSAKTHFDALKIYDVQDVQIYNAVIEGDKPEHLGKTGEWAAGISLRNAENVILKYGSIKNTWGDGIFIGSESGGVSRNISLSYFNIDNARRNGLSITSGIDVNVNHLTISNTTGTAPSCGIDIEPSLYAEELQRIALSDITTFNNATAGLAINTGNFETNEQKKRKEVTIQIKNFTDIGSWRGIVTSLNSNNRQVIPYGTIDFQNILLKDNVTLDYFFATANKFNLKLSFSGYRIFHKGKFRENEILSSFKTVSNVYVR